MVYNFYEGVDFEHNIYLREIAKKITVKNTLYWLPRSLTILIILFLGIFALDMFGTTQSLLMQIAGFVMHLLPNFLLLVILILAWRREDFGGLLFLLISVYMWLYFNNPFWVNMMLFGPIFLVGVLFLADYFYRQAKK